MRLVDVLVSKVVVYFWLNKVICHVSRVKDHGSFRRTLMLIIRSQGVVHWGRNKGFLRGITSEKTFAAAVNREKFLYRGVEKYTLCISLFGLQGASNLFLFLMISCISC